MFKQGWQDPHCKHFFFSAKQFSIKCIGNAFIIHIFTISALLSNNPDFYRKQIRIGGNYNFGVDVRLTQGTAAINPNTFFAFSTAPNSNTGIYIRLIQPVDRDVCLLNFRLHCYKILKCLTNL